LADPVGLTEYGLQSTEARAALSSFLDGLRLAVQGAPARSVVIAQVSGSRAVGRVMAGLEMAAAAKRVGLVAGELASVGSARFLNLYRVPREQRPEEEAPSARSSSNPGALHLGEASLSEVLEARIDEIDPRAEMAVIRGPGLLESVDAALLANAAIGVILVVEPLVTLGADLSRAISRVERSASQILGVVTIGTASSLPKWLRRAFGGVAG
jgi:hypothetical protein